MTYKVCTHGTATRKLTIIYNSVSTLVKELLNFFIGKPFDWRPLVEAFVDMACSKIWSSKTLLALALRMAFRLCVKLYL